MVATRADTPIAGAPPGGAAARRGGEAVRTCGGTKPGPQDGPHNGIYAAIDLGTNNCRMLVARPSAEGFRVIDSFSRITRLGEGLAGSGKLSRLAMDRTIDALGLCAEKMRRRGVTAARTVATEACRRAANGRAFVQEVRDRTGLRLETITPAEEARLALGGCAPLLDPDIPYALVFDIGGGSTELLWVELDPAGELAVQGLASLPLGVVTVAEECGGGDLCQRTYDAVKDRIVHLLRPFDLQHALADRVRHGDVQMLGTSGTVTTLGGVHLGLKRYDRSLVDGITIDFNDIVEVSRRLSTMTLRERAQHPCVGRERADLVLSGCAILEGLCELWPVGRLRVADRGLREGMLLDLMRVDAMEVA
ncbi:Ppx/GppA phosphatase family protein [Caenispirillum salinarum]|uniref:Ppx/GppA phosphatase family protein n=1 Tax=Caenispirillum salinarum TaxID=859058 RepID=UPI00384EB71B